jgi:Ca2+-binding EF-hand superfamily protein
MVYFIFIRFYLGNGRISKKEAEKAIKFINKTLGTNYTNKFLTKLDTDKDGQVSFLEFKNGFLNTANLNSNSKST